MFPHEREVRNDVLQELSGIMLHSAVGKQVRQVQYWILCDSRVTLDYMTAPDSTAAYPEPEFNKLLGYVGQIKEVGGGHGFSACVVGKPSAYVPLGVPHGFLRSFDVFLL